jgi:hypothetical protein
MDSSFLVLRMSRRGTAIRASMSVVLKCLTDRVSDFKRRSADFMSSGEESDRLERVERRRGRM